MTAIYHPWKVRLVRLVTALSLCNCLRLVTALGARLVRLVNLQAIENIALGKMESASPRALVTTLLHRPRLLARRACISRRENEAMTDPTPAAKAAAHAEAAKDNFDWPHALARVIEMQGDAFYLATALMAAQRKIDALRQHAEAMAEALGNIANCEVFPGPEWADLMKAHARKPLGNWTAWLLDGKP